MHFDDRFFQSFVMTIKSKMAIFFFPITKRNRYEKDLDNFMHTVLNQRFIDPKKIKRCNKDLLYVLK